MIRLERICSIAALLVLIVGTASACRIPVFRYALERWPPGTFELVILHAGDLTEGQATVVTAVQERLTNKDTPINLRVDSIDVSSESLSRDHQLLLRATGIDPDTITAPVATLLFPRSRGEMTIAWQGRLTLQNMTKLIDSPARQDIVGDLLAGDSAIWVLIDGPDPAANDQAAETLETELARVTELIKLPPKEVLENDEEFQAATAIELRIGFQLLRLQRDDPKESVFVEMLLNSEPDLSSFEQPIAIPIFGRGRTYYALVGKGIQPELIEENCRFVCGDCSCQVKEENPGSDLLIAANWDEGIRGSAFPEQVLPELTGIGSLGEIDLAEYERQVAQAEPEDPILNSTVAKQQSGSETVANTPPTGITASASHDEGSRSPVGRALFPVISLAVIVALVGVFLLRS